VNPTPFPESNVTLGKPKNMTDEECQPLPACKTGDGRFISRWEFSEEDRQRIAAGAPVWLHVFGFGHPVVCLSTESPFTPDPRSVS
jgi:hypothetical protein